MSFHKIMVFVFILLLGAALQAAPQNKDSWPQWRGPSADGVVPNGNPPVQWSETKNIRWKTPIPGAGLATPLVWGNQIFVQTAVEVKAQKVDPASTAKKEEDVPQWRRRMGRKADKTLAFTLFSINRKDGSVMWKKVLYKGVPHEGIHRDSTWASPSPVTDGKHIFAYFGSFGLYALDMKGNLLWKKDLGDMRIRNAFGEGSSPALHKNSIIINWDHEGDSFIVSLDKRTGKELWRRKRDERTSWSTPLVVEYKGKTQVIVNATNRIRGYDFDTGKDIWEAEGMTVNVVPTPVYENGVVYLASGFRGYALMAIKLDGAKGNITGTPNVLWSYNKNTPYTPSPLLYKDVIYFLKSNNAVLTALNAKTGAVLYGPQKLEDMKGVYASPVGVDGRVYIAGRNGVTHVIKAGNKYEVLSINKLANGIDASPVVVGNQLYIRTLTDLYCIAAK